MMILGESQTTPEELKARLEKADDLKTYLEKNPPKEKKVSDIAIADLKTELADLQALYAAIIALYKLDAKDLSLYNMSMTDKMRKNTLPVEVLLNETLEFAANLDSDIKNLGGVGFTSIDSTLDFIFDLENGK